MPRLVRHRPSPAVVVAGIALLVALGGTSVAAVTALPKNSVGTAQLKNSAVTNRKLTNSSVGTAKIQNNSVTGAKVRNGSLQKADFASGQLPAGPPAGTLSGLQTITTDGGLDSSSPKSTVATCPTGKSVIGGGSRISGQGSAKVTVIGNGPQGNAWRVEAVENDATNQSWRVTAGALCVTVAP
jgi:hypothetical protein